MADDRYDRQSFLGPDSQKIIESYRVGIAGLGGGGSHIVEQLAHVGFLDYVVFDADTVALSNLNRLVGATLQDVERQTLKIDVAQRLISGLHPDARIEALPCRWQEEPALLRSCDLVFGCVDSFSQRQELEATLRRYLIPYVDIGMDVTTISGQKPRMSGQVILSCPGHPCMYCLDFLNERTLAREAQKYGDAGNNPQVVWANGILASVAVGMAMDIVTGWTGKPLKGFYLSFDGNALTMSRNHHLDYVPPVCPHFRLADVGPPVYRRI
jgi:Dinucleotide-utilizing enzymes involved in molybdopterin and thiamine biosynthesis family 2